jgi:CheY-specific phosphatase CheX
MAATFPLDVYRADLARVVESVFQTMLNIEVEPAAALWQPAANMLTAGIYFAGDWKGALLLECGRDQARAFAGRLMPVEPGATIPEDDVRDSLGEIASMLAGSLKSVLPPGVGLSMPSVVEGADYSLRICGGNLAERAAFLSDAGLFWVTMIELVETARGRE